MDGIKERYWEPASTLKTQEASADVYQSRSRKGKRMCACLRGSAVSVASTAKPFTVAATSGIISVKKVSGFTDGMKAMLLV